MYKFITIGFITGGICAILGALYLAYDTRSEIEDWVQVEGQVVDLDVRESRESGPSGVGSSTVYRIEVTYGYKLGGKTYENTISVSESKEKDVAKYAIGSSRLLSVDPSNPNQISHAVRYDVETFMGSIIWFGLGLVFFVIGIFLWKPPKLKINWDVLFKIIPAILILIGVGMLVGAWLIYANDPESLGGPIMLGFFGLVFIVVSVGNLMNQARGTVKTEMSVSLGSSGRQARTEANGVATVLYAPGEKHSNNDEQFLQEVARFAAGAMDKVGRKKNISKISVWAEGWIQLQDGSGQREWKGVRLVLDKENWRGPMIGELSNFTELDQWQYLQLCSFSYVSEGEFPEWPKQPSGLG